MYGYKDLWIIGTRKILEDTFLIGISVLGLLMLLSIFLGFYLYFSLSWQEIAKKIGYKKSWLAWIPFANISMWFQMGGFHWAFIFLIFIPILGWIALDVLFVISNWRVFEKLGYEGWLSLFYLFNIINFFAGVLAYAIVVGIVAWGRKK
ncbi:MAG: hypothetical protein QXU40_01840 [Candidatus Pacearchaeota archaeon]